MLFFNEGYFEEVFSVIYRAARIVFFYHAIFFLLFTGLRNVYLLNLAKLGQYTLGVYVIQSLILETILVRWISFSSDYFWSFDFVIAPLISLLIVYVCLFINKVIVFKEGKLATLLF